MLPARNSKLWGGRFSKDTDLEFTKLNASIDIDKRLYAEDIEGSIVYAKALWKSGILTEEELNLLIDGLQQVRNEWEENQFKILSEDEDIHTANERRLSELIGETAHKLHTGRSRNDQSVTDTKLWLRKSIEKLISAIVQLIQVIVTRAQENQDILMPGYTHLQRAQPVKWSHWILSYAWYLKSDAEKLQQIKKSVNVLPLGSGAIAGNPFEIDREFLAVVLGFSSVSQNSMHAVGDRDFIAEFLFWASLTSVHLSKLSEDLIIFSTDEFGLIRLSDEFSTGSSLMPQKRNPDSMELIRGKTGTLIGKCTGFLTTLKGLPSTYNKDLQEDKEVLFSTFDSIYNMINITRKVIETLTINAKNCQEALNANMLATDMAYYLVRKGIPFRKAHHLIGQVVALSEAKGISLNELSLEDLRSISDNLDKNVIYLHDFVNSIEQYKTIGGTSSTAVQHQIQQFNEWLPHFSHKNL
ncbi:argininosuccinate lyase [Prorops nasuta]|uniref:argininosuccinate lyase n=1 Tax=Prorops nasuta TaxID=863751 RepID=UPI0034CD4403